MSAKRFYLPDLSSAKVGLTLPLPEDQSRHALSTMRLKSADTIEVFDGQGHHAPATLVQVSKKRCSIEIGQIIHHAKDPHQVTLFTAVPKGARVDTMVEKLSELGIHRWVPLNTENASVQPRDTKLDRLRKITIESAKQSRRPYLMAIGSLIDFASAIDSAGPDDRLLFTDTPEVKTNTAFETKRLFEDAQTHAAKDSCTINTLIFIGPEGGWSVDERESAHEHHANVWSFAPHVLRIETAAIAAASLVMASLMKA